MSFEAETAAEQTDAAGSGNQTQPNNEGQRSQNSRRSQGPKSRTKKSNTVFSSKATLKSQSKLATTAQLRETYELLGTILSEREQADAEAARIEREQIDQAEALLAQAKASGIPDHILQKVMAK